MEEVEVLVGYIPGGNGEQCGNTKGVIELCYEDSVGNEYTKDIEIETTIYPRKNTAAVTPEEPVEEEPERAGSWWITSGIVLAAAGGIGGYLLWIQKKQKEN
jgi:hypothetical protein